MNEVLRVSYRQLIHLDNQLFQSGLVNTMRTCNPLPDDVKLVAWARARNGITWSLGVYPVKSANANDSQAAS